MTWNVFVKDNKLRDEQKATPIGSIKEKDDNQDEVLGFGFIPNKNRITLNGLINTRYNPAQLSNVSIAIVQYFAEMLHSSWQM